MFDNKEKPHLIFIAEKKFDESHASSFFFDTNLFIVYRRDRVPCDVGGGITILVHKYIISEIVIDVIWSDIKVISCILKYGKTSALISCMYRSPSSSSDYSKNIRDTLTKLNTYKTDQKLICGDFNFKGIDWEKMSTNYGHSSEQQLFLDSN